MTQLGSILIADDEDTFRQSTAYLLQERGYRCDCAADGTEALRLVREKDYDLLVADIKMPGNDDLNLVRRAQELTGGTPVILVTGYPSIDTATRSVPLPVVAYLTKPVDFEELCSNVEAVMLRSRTKRLGDRTIKCMKNCADELHEAIRDLSAMGQPEGLAGLVGSLETTGRSLAECYHAVHRFHVSLAGKNAAIDPCRVLDCSRLKILERAVQESIDVIGRTKNSFKSKELGTLRRHLKGVMGGGKREANGEVL